MLKVEDGTNKPAFSREQTRYEMQPAGNANYFQSQRFKGKKLTAIGGVPLTKADIIAEGYEPDTGADFQAEYDLTQVESHMAEMLLSMSDEDCADACADLGIYFDDE